MNLALRVSRFIFRAYNQAMKGYVSNIEQETVDNDFFRKVLYTGRNSQLVLMSIAPNEDIGDEIHDLDQFIRVEKGTGKAILDGVVHDVSDGSAIVVPAGTRHNIVNTGPEALKLYTLYSPPEHKDGAIHVTKADAMADAGDHFDGKTTE